MDQTVLEIVEPGLGLSLQDLGRCGWKRFGVPPGGALDRHAARLANRLLGNLPDAPVLEVLLHGTRLRACRRVEIALTGAVVSGGPPGSWQTSWLQEGEEWAPGPPTTGVWSYLAVNGGFTGPIWFGSVSVFPRGGLGETLAAGAVLGRPDHPFIPHPPGVGRRWLDPAEQRDYLHPPPLRVWPGPQWDLFTPATHKALFGRPWTVSASSDRTGYRLDGRPLTRTAQNLPSEPVLPGSIQVPPDGRPIVTMRDGPTVGGYPKLGLVDPVDLSWLAQCRPGQPIRFTPAEPHAYAGEDPRAHRRSH